jgi:hypothetical protein
MKVLVLDKPLMRRSRVKEIAGLEELFGVRVHFCGLPGVRLVRVIFH